MNWSIFAKALDAVPYLIQFIQGIHGATTPGVTKQAAALSALATLTGGADSVLNSSDQQIANAASQVAASVINDAVAAAKAKGTGNFAPTVIGGAVDTAVGVAGVVAVAEAS